MKLLAFIPIKLTLFLILGILIGHYFSFTIVPVLIVMGLSLLTLGILLRKETQTTSVKFGSIAAILTTLLGIFIITNAQPKNHKNHYSHISHNTNALWHLKITEQLKPNSFSERYFASVSSVDLIPTKGNILLSKLLDSVQNPLRIDDEIWIYTNAKAISSSLNPHQFNYKSYLGNNGIYDQLSIVDYNYTKVSGSSKTLYGLANKFRSYCIKRLREHDFGEKELSIIQALILGDRNEISQETISDYSKAGAIHILAVSGLHIGMLLLIIQFLLRPLLLLKNGRTLVLCLSVLLLWAFAFVAGLSSSIIRATTMFSFVAYALFLNRPSNSFNILALSILFILLFINPNLVFQVGFQMSYAAVFAILWIYPLLQRLWFPKIKIVRYFWQLLSVSFAAQLGVLPISLFYFHQFPGLFFISNLVIVPTLGLILGLGLFTIFLATINLLPTWLVFLYNGLIRWMNQIVSWVAQQENFIFTAISFDFLQVVLSYFILVSFILLMTKKIFKQVILLFASILLLQSWTFYQNYLASTKSELIMPHQTKNTHLLERNGQEIQVFSTDSIAAEQIIINYKIGERIKESHTKKLQNAYLLEKRPILLIDSSGVYPNSSTKTTVVLTQSPKLNLERLIQDIHPTAIIADGSNYKSYITRWKETCLINNIPFHYTGEKGAYYFK